MDLKYFHEQSATKYEITYEAQKLCFPKRSDFKATNGGNAKVRIKSNYNESHFNWQSIIVKLAMISIDQYCPFSSQGYSSQHQPRTRSSNSISSDFSHQILTPKPSNEMEGEEMPILADTIDSSTGSQFSR